MPVLSCGARLLVRYNNNEPLFHERVILAHIRATRYLILTPENDVYIEDYADTNNDIDSVRLMHNGAVPPDIAQEPVHRFARDPTPGQLRALREEGQRLAALRGNAGGGDEAPAGGGRARTPPPIPGPDGELGRWRVSDPDHDTFDLGDMIPQNALPDDVPEHSKALVEIDGEWTFCEFVKDKDLKQWMNKKRPLDSRILRIKSQHNKRHREWSEAVSDSKAKVFADWPLKGPRTAEWCLGFLNKQPGGAPDHHALWRRTTGLGIHDYGVQEHEQILEAVGHAVAYDQLDITNSAAFEILLRRAQTIEYAHLERARESTGGSSSSSGGGKKGGKQQSGLSFEEMESFAGTSRSSVVMVAPALLEHVREDVSKRSELMKSLLKSREYREQMRKGDKET